jgi:hypothetical protein
MLVGIAIAAIAILIAILLTNYFLDTICSSFREGFLGFEFGEICFYLKLLIIVILAICGAMLCIEIVSRLREREKLARLEKRIAELEKLKG